MRNIILNNVETVAGIGFGVAVSRGTNKERQIIAGGNDFLGIAVRSFDKEGNINAGAIQRNEKGTDILIAGCIWAVCPSGCNPGDSVKYTETTGILDAGIAIVGERTITSAQWDTVAAAGELAVIRINSPAIAGH